MYVQSPGGMSAHSTRDINLGLAYPHFLLEIPLDEVFTPYDTGRANEAKTVAMGKQRSLHLSIKDDQLLAQQGIFYNQIGTAARR